MVTYSVGALNVGGLVIKKNNEVRNVEGDEESITGRGVSQQSVY